MNRKRVNILIAVAVMLIVSWTLVHQANRPPRASGPIPYQTYVWQRDWNDDVKAAVRDMDAQLPTPVLLAGEVTWQNGRPTVARVAIEFSTLGGRPFALALRIGAIDPDAIDRGFITQLAGSIIAAAPHPPRELEIDFDCAESKLAGYTRLVSDMKSAVMPVPVVITALPSWLKRRDFLALARLGPYVLQVHSLQRPSDATGELKLIDPAAAAEAVERAAAIGVPFRVALPTYGSVAVFDRNGKFVRLYSENAPPLDDPSLVVQYVQTEPAQLAELIRQWQADRPACMTGAIWYRLPVASDTLNWRPATLKAVMNGRMPLPHVVVASDKNAGLADLSLVNEGDGDARLPERVVIEWTGRAPIAGDAINGYEKLDGAAGSVTLSLIDRHDTSTNRAAKGMAPSPADVIRAGDRRAIGWLRFTQDTEVRGHVSTSPATATSP